MWLTGIRNTQHLIHTNTYLSAMCERNMYAHTHAHTHAHIHTHTHAQTHARACTHTRMYTLFNHSLQKERESLLKYEPPKGQRKLMD